MSWIKEINFKNIRIRSKCCTRNDETEPPTPKIIIDENILHTIILLEEEIIKLNKKVDDYKNIIDLVQCHL